MNSPYVEIIIAQHHERPDQSGFPRGIGALQISPLAAVFILAEELTNKIIIESMAADQLKNLVPYFENNFNKGNFKNAYKGLMKSGLLTR